MAMENGPFEDVFPIKDGHIPASYVCLHLSAFFSWPFANITFRQVRRIAPFVSGSVPRNVSWRSATCFFRWFLEQRLPWSMRVGDWSPSKKLVGMNGIMTRTSTIFAEKPTYPHPDLAPTNLPVAIFYQVTIDPWWTKYIGNWKMRAHWKYEGTRWSWDFFIPKWLEPNIWTVTGWCCKKGDEILMILLYGDYDKPLQGSLFTN